MISHQHKFIFIHPAKTGGNSIEVVLALHATGAAIRYPGFDLENKQIVYLGRDIKHHRLAFFHEHLRERIRDFYVFATTRNPWDRIVSAWRYYNTQYGNPIPFEVWLESIGQRKEIPKFLRSLMDEVMDYVAQPKGREVPVHFIEFMRLQEDFDKVCSDIGLPRIELPHTLKTKHEHYSTYYDKSSRNMIAASYARDIERFGYRFEEAK